MYHPAKIREKITSNDETAFMVETWDENVFTVGAADSINPDNISEGTVVMLDYYPDEAFDMPTPKQVVAMVLDDEQGKQVWSKYRDLFEEQSQQQTAPVQQMPNAPFDGGYIG